jgi:enoyl-CoA hydratase
MNTATDPELITQRVGRTGLITLARPKALNALSLNMVRGITAALAAWASDPAVTAVVVHGAPRVGADGKATVHFCAGGDIRFFHTAALAGDAALDDFFTEEYALNHLIHTYPKPYITLIDGVCMGGGMGIAGHGAAHSLRVATPQAKLAMPETNIGLFPDVGGGFFLSRLPGGMGPYLALTGHVLSGAEALALGLADGLLSTQGQAAVLQGLASGDAQALLVGQGLNRAPSAEVIAGVQALQARVDRFFTGATALAIVQALEACPSADPDHAWAQQTAAGLRKKSPLMCEVSLRQLQRARGMSLAQDLRLERDMVRHCFAPHHLGRKGNVTAQSETVEGIRALAVDKDHAPRWQPARLEEVTHEMVAGFFESPWAADAHPLANLP